jgi:hypothetical protein
MQHKELWRQNSLDWLTKYDTTASSGRELCHLQFSLQAISPETFGYTFLYLPFNLKVGISEIFHMY